LGTPRCKRTFINCCTDYFVANCETLITNDKPGGAFIEVIGIADLFIFVRRGAPKARGSVENRAKYPVRR
jgi:hypothetical protein